MTTSPEHRNPFMEILSAVEPDGRQGVFLTREQLEAWAGRSLTDEEVDDLENAIPNSSIPDAVATICDGFNEDDNEAFESGRLADSGIGEED